jgi:hypothetical protein
MIKYFLIYLFVAPSLSLAHNICPVNTKIADDMYVPESYYSKENAVISIDLLSGIIKEDQSSGEWINVPNA